MNKLELKHIVGYLPYKLECKYKDWEKPFQIVGTSGKALLLEGDWTRLLNYTQAHLVSLEFIKPILRPISSMTNEEAYQLGVLISNKNEMEDKTVGIGKMTVGEWEVPIINYADIDGEEYSFMVMFFNHGISATNGNNITFEAYEWLYENHFDIYGLIKQGLAIDINTL